MHKEGVLVGPMISITNYFFFFTLMTRSFNDCLNWFDVVFKVLEYVNLGIKLNLG